jgi:hypothetical protein
MSQNPVSRFPALEIVIGTERLNHHQQAVGSW